MHNLTFDSVDPTQNTIPSSSSSSIPLFFPPPPPSSLPTNLAKPKPPPPTPTLTSPPLPTPTPTPVLVAQLRTLQQENTLLRSLLVVSTEEGEKRVDLSKVVERMRLLTRENEELEVRILDLVGDAAEKGGVKEEEMEEREREGEGEEGLRKAVDGEFIGVILGCKACFRGRYADLVFFFLAANRLPSNDLSTRVRPFAFILPLLFASFSKLTHLRSFLPSFFPSAPT